MVRLFLRFLLRWKGIKYSMEVHTLILGRHLVLTMLPKCFLFKAYDMNPSVSKFMVFLLTDKVLSSVTSVMGKPLYTNKLTQTKEPTTYACFLMEVDAMKPGVNDLNILLHIEEYDMKYCVDCKIVGHSAGGCDEKIGNTNTRDSYKRMNGNRMRSSRHKEKETLIIGEGLGPTKLVIMNRPKILYLLKRIQQDRGSPFKSDRTNDHSRRKTGCA